MLVLSLSSLSCREPLKYKYESAYQDLKATLTASLNFSAMKSVKIKALLLMFSVLGISGNTLVH